MESDIREGGVSGKGRLVDVTYGCVWACLGVVGYRLGGVSGKGRHRDVWVCIRERDKDRAEWGGLTLLHFDPKSDRKNPTARGFLFLNLPKITKKHFFL